MCFWKAYFLSLKLMYCFLNFFEKKKIAFMNFAPFTVVEKLEKRVNSYP